MSGSSSAIGIEHRPLTPPGGTESAERLALTLAGSLLVHFALIFGMQIHDAGSSRAPAPPVRAKTFEARLEHAAPMPATPPPAETTLPEDAPPAPPGDTAKPPSSTPEHMEELPSVELPLLEDPVYYPAAEVDVHPAALHFIQPPFPDAASAAGVNGSVILLLLLDESGVVREISVEEASPPGYFEQSALDAFRNARFSPAQRQGRPVKSRMRIKVAYEQDPSPGKEAPVDNNIK